MRKVATCKEGEEGVSEGKGRQKMTKEQNDVRLEEPRRRGDGIGARE